MRLRGEGIVVRLLLAAIIGGLLSGCGSDTTRRGERLDARAKQSADLFVDALVREGDLETARKYSTSSTSGSLTDMLGELRSQGVHTVRGPGQVKEACEGNKLVGTENGRPCVLYRLEGRITGRPPGSVVRSHATFSVWLVKEGSRWLVEKYDYSARVEVR